MNVEHEEREPGGRTARRPERVAPRAALGGSDEAAQQDVFQVSAEVGLARMAVDRVRSDFRRLTTGEQIAAITVTALVASGALAGVMSQPETRQMVLDQLNGRILPVPGVSGLSLEVNTERENLMVGLHLDVGALLPASLGFGPGSPSPIGAPPRR